MKSARPAVGRLGCPALSKRQFLHVIGASYGFGNPEEIKKYPSIGTAAVPLDILNIIRGNR